MGSNLSARGRKILVAEDDSWIRNLLVRVLNDEGYSTHAVTNGIDALEQLNQHAYHLAILDVQMPGIGAIEIARQHYVGGKTTPIVVLTADATNETADNCRKQGIRLVLAKPVHTDDLVRSIEAVLNGSVLLSRASVESTIHDAGELIDRETFQRLVQACGREFVEQLLQQFNEQVENLLAEIERSYSTRNYASLQELLHRFEGTAGTIGASAIAALARTLRERCESDGSDVGDQLNVLRADTRSTVRVLSNNFQI